MPQIRGIHIPKESNAKNYIINGNFDYWQRTTSVSNTGPGYVAADRISIRGSNIGAALFSRSTDVPVIPASAGVIQPTYSLSYACTSTATPAAGELRAIGYTMEGNDLRHIAGKTFTISFWVKAFQTGTWGFSIKNAGNTRAYHTTYTINASNTWEFKSIVMNHNTSGVWDYSTGSGLELGWILAAGTSFQTSTFNSWTNDTNFRGPAANPNFYSSTSNTFQLSQLMLNEGSVAAPFCLYGGTTIGELIACQRYYEKSAGLATNPGVSTAIENYHYTQSGATNASASAGVYVPFKVQKRAVLSSSNVAIWDFNGTPNGGFGAACRVSSINNGETIASHNLSLNLNQPGQNGLKLSANVTTASGLIFQWAAESEI